MQIAFMFALSSLLILYGVATLFKQEWIVKVREFSARVEGKRRFKRLEGDELNRVGKGMGIVSLLLGLVGFGMNIALLVVLFINN